MFQVLGNKSLGLVRSLDILYFRKEKFSYSEKDFDSVSVNILENIYKANKDQVSSKVIC